MTLLSRRNACSLGAAGLVAPAAARAWATDSLQAAGEMRGIRVGSAVNITSLRRDPAYGLTIARECGIVVAENEMKMEYVEKQPGALTFEGGDETLQFAQANGLGLRGTVLVWYRGMPDWASGEVVRGRAETFMRRWIGIIAGRYAGRVESWDVVNEITDPRSADGLARTPWWQALGPRYIDLAFEAAASADPVAARLWNEDDLEMDAPWMDQRRTAVLHTLEALLRRGVPIQRLGIQSHLNSKIPFDAGKLRKFLADVAGMGLAIEITELDVDDRAFPADPVARDRGVADLTRRYLDTVLDEKAVLNVLTWDIIDRNTWLNSGPRRRPDGERQRSLPIGADYARKPMHAAIRQALIDAPDHAAARHTQRG